MLYSLPIENANGTQWRLQPMLLRSQVAVSIHLGWTLDSKCPLPFSLCKKEKILEHLGTILSKIPIILEPSSQKSLVLDVQFPTPQSLFQKCLGGRRAFSASEAASWAGLIKLLLNLQANKNTFSDYKLPPVS